MSLIGPHSSACIRRASPARVRKVFREVFSLFQLYLSGVSTYYPDDFAVYLNIS
jgi:hypothetical protein